MNKRGILFIISACAVYLFQGCAIDQTVYLQNVSTSGPMNQPPLHITTSNDSSIITLSPKLFINTTSNLNGQVDGHSKVNRNGIYQVDTIFNADGTRNLHESSNNIYDFNENNFHWSLPDGAVGIDFDLRLSKLIAFSGGINYSVINQQILMGGSLGLGMYASHDNSGNRFDIGIMWQEMYYNASTVVVTNYQSVFESKNSQDVAFYKDRDKFTAYNFYGMWTYNSVNSKLPFDYYFGLGLFGQTVVDFKPTSLDGANYWPGTIRNDARSEVTTSYLMGMLGIYENLDEHNRISCGIRVLKEFQIKNLSESVYIFPTIQMDMTF